MKLTNLFEAAITIKVPPANAGSWCRTMLFRALLHSKVKLVISAPTMIQPPHSADQKKLEAGTYPGVITDQHISRTVFKFDDKKLGEGLFFNDDPQISKIVVIEPVRHVILKVLLSYLKTASRLSNRDRMAHGLLEAVVLLRKSFNWTELEAIQKSVEELLDESK